MKAGWFPDPSRQALQRYWDGSTWTNHVITSTGQSVDDGPGMTSLAITGGYAPRYPPAYQPQVMIAPKSPAVSLLISFFIPGVGSMVNGDTAKGVGILIGWFVSLLLVVLVIGLFTAPAFWIWGLVDAYQGAQQWNAKHGIVS